MKPHEKKKHRVDLGSDGPLGDTPFALLRGASENTPPPVISSTAPPKAARASEGRPFRVLKSRKGNWPIAVERRGGGKLVTILRNVEGDPQALLAALRKHCGAGGAAREDSVEIQGDQSEKVVQFLEKRE